MTSGALISREIVSLDFKSFKMAVSFLEEGRLISMANWLEKQKGMDYEKKYIYILNVLSQIK